MAKHAELFGGMSPKELRKMYGIPKDFRVDEFMGVPMKKIPRAYLYVIIDGAIYEAKTLRSKIEGAFALGEKMTPKAPEQKDGEAEKTE